MAARIFSGPIKSISRLTIITRSCAGNRCCALRKLSRNSRFNWFRFTAVGICLRATAKPGRGLSPVFLPTRIVIQESAHRKLFLKTCRNSKARVSLDLLGKDSPVPAPTLRGEARSAFRATRLNNTSAAAGLHARTETMRSCTLNFTGLKCTFHIERLGSLFVAFNKARQCTVRLALRQ